MPTDCRSSQLEFEGFARRRVIADFEGGPMTSDAGTLLLRHTDRAIGLLDRVAACFTDHRMPELVEHQVRSMVGQRIAGVALGYEDINDHDDLRHDPVLALLSDRLEPRRKDCAVLAGKSTLNRMEHAPSGKADRYHKISHDPEKLETLFVDLFLEANKKPPKRIILDLDATDDPLHGHQEGRFYHGYYGCYCYLPLYIFCGHHLLAAKLRPCDIDGSAGAKEEIERIVKQIRTRWPKVKIWLRADSGFARDELMTLRSLCDRLFQRRRGEAAGVNPTRSIMSSAWRRTAVCSNDWRQNWPRQGPSIAPALTPPDASKTSRIAPSIAGADGAGWSAKPSISTRGLTRGLSLPPSNPRRSMAASFMRGSTA